MRSPGRTTKRAPGATSAAGVGRSSPPSTTRTVGGDRSSSDSTARRARPTLHPSRTSERPNRKATVAASSHCPRATAPPTAAVISRFMSGRSERAENHALGTTNQPPAATASR